MEEDQVTPDESPTEKTSTPSVIFAGPSTWELCHTFRIKDLAPEWSPSAETQYISRGLRLLSFESEGLVGHMSV